MEDNYVKKALITSACVIVVVGAIMLISEIFTRSQYELMKKDIGSLFRSTSKVTNNEIEKLRIESETRIRESSERRKAELVHAERMKKEDSQECRFWRQQSRVDEKSKARIKEFCGNWE